MRFTEAATDLFKNVKKEAEAKGIVTKPKPKSAPKKDIYTITVKIGQDVYDLDIESVGEPSVETMKAAADAYSRQIGGGEYSDRFLPAGGGAQPRGGGVKMPAPDPKRSVMDLLNPVNSASFVGTVAKQLIPGAAEATAGIAEDVATGARVASKGAKATGVQGFVPSKFIGELFGGGDPEQREAFKGAAESFDPIPQLPGIESLAKQIAGDLRSLKDRGKLTPEGDAIYQSIARNPVEGLLPILTGLDTNTVISAFNGDMKAADKVRTAINTGILSGAIGLGGAMLKATSAAAKAGNVVKAGAKAIDAGEAGAALVRGLKGGVPDEVAKPFVGYDLSGLPKPKPTSVLDEVLGTEPLKTSPAETLSAGSVLDEVLDAPKVDASRATRREVDEDVTPDRLRRVMRQQPKEEQMNVMDVLLNDMWERADDEVKLNAAVANFVRHLDAVDPDVAKAAAQAKREDADIWVKQLGELNADPALAQKILDHADGKAGGNMPPQESVGGAKRYYIERNKTLDVDVRKDDVEGPDMVVVASAIAGRIPDPYKLPSYVTSLRFVNQEDALAFANARKWMTPWRGEDGDWYTAQNRNTAAGLRSNTGTHADQTGNGPMPAPVRPAETTLPTGATPEPTAQTVTPDATTPTSARQADINADREALGKAGFSTDDVRKWTELEAKANPNAVPKDDSGYKTGAWTDQETVNATAKLRELKSQIETLRKSGDDPETLVTLEDEFDNLTEAMYRSGTEQGRALAARRYTMDVDMSADGLRARYKARAAKNGTKVDTKRLAELEQIAKDYKALKEQIDRKSPLDIDALTPNDPRLDPMHYDGLTDSSLYDPEFVNRAYVELFGDLPDDLPLDARAKAAREGLQERINRAIEEDVRAANVDVLRDVRQWFRDARGGDGTSGWNVAVPGRNPGQWVAGPKVRMIDTQELPPEYLQMFIDWLPTRNKGAERYIRNGSVQDVNNRGLMGTVAEFDELIDRDGSRGVIPQTVVDEFVRDLTRMIGDDTGEVVVRRQRRVHLDSEFDDLLSQFKKAALSSANTGIPPELVPIVGKMVANRIKAGAASIEDIVVAIQKKFRERLLDPPERQDIIDAYAEYKATAKPEPNERAQKLREKRSKIEREMREESTQRKSKYVADAEAKAKRAAEAADARAKKAAERQQRIEADRNAKADQKAKARAEREAADAEAKALREEQERILSERKDWDKRNADKKRELERLNARIAELEKSIEAGTGMGPKIRKPSKDAADVERARARMDMLKRRAKAIYEAQNRQSSPVMDATREVTGALRWTQLGADVGALFRQGLYGLTRPAAWGRSAVKGAKALVSEAEFEVGMSQIFNREIKGNLMEPIRRRAGLQLTDSITDVEEGFISRLLSKVPIIGRPLERGQAMFLNALRADVFDTFYKNLPDATAQELASRAQFINSAFGRSNLKRVNETLQIVMTSPRYTASRWEMAGAALKYGPKAVKDRGARANIQDLAVAAGGIITALKIAEASGAEVEWDPTSTDFGKIRVGKTVYDPTAGVAMPIRTAMRIYTYITTKGSAGYNGNPMDEGFNVLGNTLSPGIRKPIESMMGQSMRGYELDDVEKSAWGWAPLIVQGVVKNWGDLGQMGAQAGAEFVGINSNKYDKPKQTFRDRIDKNVETFKKKNP